MRRAYTLSKEEGSETPKQNLGCMGMKHSAGAGQGPRGAMRRAYTLVRKKALKPQNKILGSFFKIRSKRALLSAVLLFMPIIWYTFLNFFQRICKKKTDE